MSQKRIENQFQKALGNYASMVDEDQLWSEIENRVPKKKRKKRILIWLVFGLPVLIFLLFGIWLISEDNIDTKPSHSVDEYLENEVAEVQESEAIKPIANRESMTSGSNWERESMKPVDNSDSSISWKNPIASQPKKQIDTDFNVSEEDLYLRELDKFNGLHLQIKDENSSNLLIEESKMDRNNMDVNPLTPIKFTVLDYENVPFVKPPFKVSKKAKQINSLKKERPFVALNYYSGKYISKGNISSQNDRYIDFGEAYFSQGQAISYNYFLAGKLYGRVIFTADQSYKKYSDRVDRDTIVPSSMGIQDLVYNQYQNGMIDTEFGIPQVNGVYNRDVINLNVISSLSVGLGLGYTIPLGKMKLNLEADIQRTIYYDISGLGRDPSLQRIADLKSFENYFSDTPKYSINAQMNFDYDLGKSLLLSAGIQYQLGVNSILVEQTNHIEKINLLRGNLGIKRIL